MRNIIRDLYHGKTDAFELPLRCDNKHRHAFAKMELLEQKLEEMIPEESRCVLQEYTDACMDFVDACSEDEFVNGYRVGVQMMIAAWPVHSNAEE